MLNHGHGKNNSGKQYLNHRNDKVLIFLLFLCRYYLLPDGSAVARMVDAELSYTYEYLGNTPKLVHTPLTDKCYLTLTQVMKYFLVFMYINGSFEIVIFISGYAHGAWR
jgi:hypothetical protein